MLRITHTKHAPCPTCKGTVVGRSDKRFCSLKCKNEHHRVARNYFKSRYQEINRKIRRNLTVVEGILGTGYSCMAIHKDALFKHGFDINICTSATRTSGNVIYELGDYTYKVTKDGVVMVKRNQIMSAMMPVFFDRWAIDFPVGLKVGKSFKPGDKKNCQAEISRWNE